MKFGSAMHEIERADLSSMSDEQHRFFVEQLLVHFGVAVGIMLAEHADKPEETCAEVAALIRDHEASHYFATGD